MVFRRGLVEMLTFVDTLEAADLGRQHLTTFSTGRSATVRFRKVSSRTELPGGGITLPGLLEDLLVFIAQRSDGAIVRPAHFACKSAGRGTVDCTQVVNCERKIRRFHGLFLRARRDSGRVPRPHAKPETQRAPPSGVEMRRPNAAENSAAATGLFRRRSEVPGPDTPRPSTIRSREQSSRWRAAAGAFRSESRYVK